MVDRFCDTRRMETWHREIVELHQFFEQYFWGLIDADDVGRLEAALAPEFTIVGPGGDESTRADTIAAVRRAHAHTSQLKIEIHDARLLIDRPESLVARYVEHQETGAVTTDRLSTVVFARDAGAPNGLRWLAVHETWSPDEPAAV